MKFQKQIEDKLSESQKAKYSHWYDDCGFAKHIKQYYGNESGQKKPIGADLGKIFLEILSDQGIVGSINEMGLVDFEYAGMKFIGGFDDNDNDFEIFCKGGWKCANNDEVSIAEDISMIVNGGHLQTQLVRLFDSETNQVYFIACMSLHGIFPEYVKETLWPYLDSLIKASTKFKEDMAEHCCTVVEYITEYLNSQEGIRAGIDEEGNIIFSCEEINYNVFIQNSDYAIWFHIANLGFGEIDNPQELDAVLRCSFDTSASINSVKFFLSDDSRNISAYVCGAIASRKEIPLVFPDYFGCLCAGVEEFCKKIDDYK